MKQQNAIIGTSTKQPQQLVGFQSSPIVTWLILAAAVLFGVPAFSAQDIPPGAPVGSCCRVDGREGSSQQRPGGIWSCQMNSIAFKSAWDAGLFPFNFNRATLSQTAVTSSRIYPKCPAGWTLSAKAGLDVCVAPTTMPACPIGTEVSQDGDGMKDVCKERFAVVPQQPAIVNPPAKN